MCVLFGVCGLAFVVRRALFDVSCLLLVTGRCLLCVVRRVLAAVCC